MKVEGLEYPSIECPGRKCAAPLLHVSLLPPCLLASVNCREHVVEPSPLLLETAEEMEKRSQLLNPPVNPQMGRGFFWGRARSPFSTRPVAGETPMLDPAPAETRILHETWLFLGFTSRLTMFT